MQAATRFVVLTTQRNGSTWLMSVLNSLDGVSGQGELFLPRPRTPERRWDSDFAHPRYVESAARFGTRRPRSVFRYLDDLYSAPHSVGFSLMYSQLRSFPEILVFLMRDRIPVIHLVRRNHLDVLISFAVKGRIGQAHILSPAERPREISVELDTASLLKDLERLQHKHDVGRRVLRVCRLRHIEVGYEDLVADPADFRRVFSSWGSP